MKPTKREGLAMASLMCAAPCVLITIRTLHLYFFVEHTHRVSEDIMELGIYALWLSPIALASLILAAFARGYRKTCLALILFYFIGWIVVIIADGGLR